MKNYLFFVVVFIGSVNLSYSQTVTIGTQVWTTENLDVSTYRSGDVIPQVQDRKKWGKLTTGAWCYYNNDPSNETKYGKLYNWYAVNDPRGLAPAGYHIPSDAEWTILTDYLGDGDAGTKMKSTSGWVEDCNGDDASGFLGLPGGLRDKDGTFKNRSKDGFWWSSTENLNFNFVYYINLWCNSIDGSAWRESNPKEVGFSVRCLKD
jgi:uncharacterized protein (TIGR02145 family)